MLLIRGFNQEQFAREIETGVIGFRDLLTTLLYHENNGYKLSNYYEKSIIEAAAESNIFELDLANEPSHIAKQLSLIFNPFIPHFFLSYFHILNENSEEWLDENFDDSFHFVYAIPKLQKLEIMDEMLFGRNMVGSRMIYLPLDGIARTPNITIQKAGMVCLMQNELDACKAYGSNTRDVLLALNNMIVSVCDEAFSRRCDEKFNDSENEFRLIYKTPTPFIPSTGCFEPTEKRPIYVAVDGVKYEGTYVNQTIPTLSGIRKSHNLLLETQNPMIVNPITTIKNAFDSGKKVEVLPYFKPVKIHHSFQEYGYIGSKEQCRRFIDKHLGTMFL